MAAAHGLRLAGAGQAVVDQLVDDSAGADLVRLLIPSDPPTLRGDLGQGWPRTGGPSRWALQRRARGSGSRSPSAHTSLADAGGRTGCRGTCAGGAPTPWTPQDRSGRPRWRGALTAHLRSVGPDGDAERLRTAEDARLVGWVLWGRSRTREPNEKPWDT